MAIFYTSTDVLKPASAQQLRAATMDDFLSDLHRDVDRAAYISGFRAFIALEQSVANSGEYLDDIESDFASAFLNGTIGEESYDILDNSSFTQYLERVGHEASLRGMVLNMSVLNVSLYHITPWIVAIDYDILIMLNDTRAATRWSYVKTFSTQVPIFDLRDPLYAVGTNNKALNTVRIVSGFSEFVNDAGDQNDTTVLVDFLDSSYYSHSTLAPSFLMRFEGNLSANKYGIESLVNLDELDTQDVLILSTRSVVDYLYFGSAPSDDWCNVQNMPSYFKLDDDHRDFYEIDGELEYSACI